MRGQAHHGEKVVWGNETYDVEVIETLEHSHLAPHALLIPL